ncbi:CRISPR-associated endonuclease Cas2 (plasmid) [Halobiforma lacisalsi AJ5]|uniref:CRISPR-associated endoribonuclease Cas2 n=2 Tax=Natronobacterium lacisalsi TaxID=229731 RepID=M0LCL3_NATLA|nr:CRISPR-associated endonuclease Cas2 [Halobiforma lacisalsi AJ5]EMA30164.1 CRISPR-associated protein Cas2 [Halobiforma lacisalsi AJ5]
MHVIVVYDVSSDRTHIFRKLLRRRLEHVQQSVFFGELTEGQVTSMKNEIEEKLVPEDSVVVFESTSPAAFDFTTFGASQEPGSRFT